VERDVPSAGALHAAASYPIYVPIYLLQSQGSESSELGIISITKKNERSEGKKEREREIG